MSDTLLDIACRTRNPKTEIPMMAITSSNIAITNKTLQQYLYCFGIFILYLFIVLSRINNIFIDFFYKKVDKYYMNEFNGNEIVTRIDECLKAMGKTREELAEFCGFNKQNFTNWRGRNIIPKSDDLYNMSQYLGVPMEYLLFGEDIMPDNIAVIASLLTPLSDEKRSHIFNMIKMQIEFWDKEGK